MPVPLGEPRTFSPVRSTTRSLTPLSIKTEKRKRKIRKKKGFKENNRYEKEKKNSLFFRLPFPRIACALGVTSRSIVVSV